MRSTTENIIFNKDNIILNLNNQTITGKLINNGANLQVKDGFINYNEASNADGVIRSNSGSILIDDVKIDATQSTYAIFISGGAATLNSVRANSSQREAIRIIKSDSGNVSITGGNYESSNYYGLYYKSINNDVKLTITNTNIEGNNSGLVQNGTGTIEIDKSTIIGHTQFGINATESSANIIVKGSSTYINGTWNAILFSSNGKLQILDGTIDGTNIAISAVESGNIDITGGHIIGNNQNGIHLNSQYTGTITVMGSAVIDGNTWDGINASGGNIIVSGGTITGVCNGIFASSSTNIKVNGGHIIGSNQNGITLDQYDGTLTVSGSSIIDGNAWSGIAANSGNVIILGGAITGVCDGIYVTGSSNIDIQSGIITGMRDYGLNRSSELTGKVIISPNATISGSLGSLNY